MKSAVPVFVIIFIAFLLSSCGGDADTTESETPFEPITYEVLFESGDFTNAEKCGECHVEIFQQWRGSMHNNALEDDLYKALHDLGSEETGGAIDAFCTTCHSPIGTFSGEVPPIEGQQVSDISKDGVQCDFCHTVTGSSGIGNASFIFEPSNTKRGPFNDASSPFHGTEYSELHTKSEFCGMCHNLNHPLNGTALEATYAEWRNSPYPEQDIQCQDCHMTPGPLVTKPNPGQAAEGGPQRQQIYTHNIVGGNATSLAGESHRQLAEERLKNAAAIEIVQPQNPSTGQSMKLDVNVTNTGAGHYLPTGLTEVREMWLEIAVTDANGLEVFHSGVVDENKDIEPDTVIYHTIFKDAEGNETHLPWEAEGILLDHRIPPKETVTETYEVPLAGDITKPLTIKATLNYRSAPAYLVDMLLGKEAIDLPIVEMTSAETVVQ